MIAALLGRETIEVPCTVEIEKTPKSLHAHVVLDGDIEIRPGDKVIVHDAPTEIGFGETLSVRRMATITARQRRRTAVDADEGPSRHHRTL